MDDIAAPQPSREPIPVTENLMNQRLRAHEKAAWLLRASLQP
jgi:DNA-binding ferritin-like protein